MKDSKKIQSNYVINSIDDIAIGDIIKYDEIEYLVDEINYVDGTVTMKNGYAHITVSPYEQILIMLEHYVVDIDDINRGDTIKVIEFNDAFLNIDHQYDEGVVTSICYKTDSIKGTWGKYELYPGHDKIQLLNHIKLTPIGG